MTQTIGTETSPTQYFLGDWVFHPAHKQLKHLSGEEHQLEDKVSDLLALLCARRGEVVSREDILAVVWEGRSLSEQTVPVAISKIRKALGEAGIDGKLLQTIPKRGYKIAEESPEAVAIPPLPHVEAPPKRASRLLPFSLLAIALLLVAFLWPKAPPFTPAADADKPGIILTVKDIRTTLESEQNTSKVIALSELASFYLSQIPEVLVIRHWWNVDAPDPTGGIFTRYGADTPVYLLTGSLIEDAGTQMVSLFLSNPKTDEVIWSGMHPVEAGSHNYFDTLARMFETIGVLSTPQADGRPVAAPTEDNRYWAARYLMHLSYENSAKNAANMLGEMLAENPGNSAALQTAKALAVRWPAIAQPQGTFPTSSTRSDHIALTDEAAIAFYETGDTRAAHQLLDEALKIAPGDHYALSLKAEILFAQGEKEAALNAYRKAARLAPFAATYERRLSDISETGTP